MAFDHDFNEYNSTPRNPDPGQSPLTPPQTGSYYSPRSSSGFGGNIPPESPYPDDPADQSAKPKSHKGLKALGIFAAIAVLSYTSIVCYRFATQNESMRKFFGHDDISSNVDSSLEGLNSSSVPASSSNSDETSPATPLANKSLFELAARKDAMSIPDIVDKVMPASVGVSSTFVYQRQMASMWGFGEPQTTEQELTGTGTGIIMSEDGYIVTNAHVIYDSSDYKCGLAKEVTVVLNEKCYTGETQFEATVVGYDVEEDIAVLKIDTQQKLVTAEFGSSDDLRVGELVIAIGNPLGFDLFGSVTTGIVSALDREVTINESTMRLIQTNAAINSGNSGGPLINSYGQVIGINSAKLSNNYYGEASVEGLCFAIPMSHAKTIIDDLISYGYVRGKPLIGISSTDVTEQISQAYGLPMGVYVREVTEGGAADFAGIQKGDVIIAVNGESITCYEELNNIKNTFKAGDTITLTVTRGTRDMDFELKLQEKQPTDE